MNHSSVVIEPQVKPSDTRSDVSSAASFLSSPPPSPLAVPEGLTLEISQPDELRSHSLYSPSDTEEVKPVTPKKRPRLKRKKSALISPYFKPTPPATPSKKKKRPPAGTVSCIPFPPLSQTSFGLIQEKLANDPFKLLIAVTFLNRTKGIYAIPVFNDLMTRYPTPEDLAQADESEVADIIRHLGLQNIRAKRYVQLAKIWVSDPPSKGKRYRKLHYPQRNDGKDIKPGESLDEDDTRVGWEIAHLPTAGPYAIDSWRIFCRDVLRGRARGWNGEGAVAVPPIFPSGRTTGNEMERIRDEIERTSGEVESTRHGGNEEHVERITGHGENKDEDDKEEFEPEWKRVVPLDKELRAFLRWMWLKEGWEWDPLTGSRWPASRALMEKAVLRRVVWEEEELEREIGDGGGGGAGEECDERVRKSVEEWDDGGVRGLRVGGYAIGG